MKHKSLIWIKINNNNYSSIIRQLYNLHIAIYDSKEKNDNLLIKVNDSDYPIIKRHLFLYDIEVYSKTGLLKYINYLKKYIYFFLSVIVGIMILLLLNGISYKVEIKNNNISIKEEVLKELKKYQLTGVRFKKSHQEIEKIIQKILDSNKQEIEWMEIKYDGLKMIVNVVEKSKENDNELYDNCDIIAKTDAKIISMNVYKGDILRDINDYVKKGEVLLSGTIMSNDEIKNKVCAGGKIFGEVWYKVKIRMPLKENKIKYTGKERYNISLVSNNKDYYIFRNRISPFKVKRINLYSLNNFRIDLIKEKEYVIEEKYLTEKESYDLAVKKALEKLNKKLSKEDEIINQKVLKKSLNNSTIYLEIFVVTKENIGYTRIIREDGLIDSQLDVKNN